MNSPWTVRRLCIYILGFGVLGGAPLAPEARADFVLTSDNNRILVDPNNGVGAHSWTINGVSQLSQEWFYYRVGDQTPEGPFNSSTLISASQPSADTLNLNYSDNSTWLVHENFQLTGSPTNTPVGNLAESVVITNISTSQSLPFRFFAYTNLDLGGSPISENVGVTGGRLLNLDYALFSQVGGTDSVTTILSPVGMSNYELNTYPSTLNKLTNGTVDNLNSPFIPSGFSASMSGNADYTWAIEWTLNLKPGESFIISQGKLISPGLEPSSVVMMGFGAIALVSLALLRHRKGRARR